MFAERFGTIKALRAATVTDISSLYGGGEVVAEAVVAWFKDKHHQRIVDELLKYITTVAEETVSATLEGKSFVLTGTLTQYSRDEAKEEIQKRGGKVSGSVSRKTDYVVVGTEPGSKATDATMLGVTVLKEDDFLKLLAK